MLQKCQKSNTFLLTEHYLKVSSFLDLLNLVDWNVIEILEIPYH